MSTKVVLAYSGGLDTSIIIPYLKETHGLEVHCYAGDVGQGAQELQGLEEKAARSGAVSCKVDDVRHEFLVDYVWPCLRAMTVYEGRYLLGTSMARPVLAKGQVAYAAEVGADYVAHGCTGKGNDQVRFELGYMCLNPDLKIIAPWRDWDIRSREDALDYAHKHGIEVAATKTNLYSRDRNLWHISHEGGVLEEPANHAPEDVYMLTIAPEQAPDTPEYVTLGFERGVPTHLGGEQMDPVPLLEVLNELGGKHGVGRVDITENRLVGMKSRGVYETPGGTIILEALKTLRSITVERDTARMCERLMLEYADLVYTGRWFHPLRESLDAFFSTAAEHVTGEVEVKLYKGCATAVGTRSPFSLYSEDLATFGDGAEFAHAASRGFDHADSRGFVKLYGLPGAVAANAHGASGAPGYGGKQS